MGMERQEVVTAGGLIQQGRFDPIQASLTAGLVITFPKLRAGSYAPAVNMCRGASKYHEEPIEGVLTHFAAFARDRHDMGRALAVVSTLRGYKGLLIYAGGKLQNWARVQKVLECYMDSLGCKDTRAHCVISVHKDSVTTYPEPLTSVISITPDFMEAKREGKAYLFPCRLLAFNFCFKLQAGHPSSDVDQIQAGAVREGCDWCPSFLKAGG